MCRMGGRKEVELGLCECVLHANREVQKQDSDPAFTCRGNKCKSPLVGLVDRYNHLHEMVGKEGESYHLNQT